MTQKSFFWYLSEKFENIYSQRHMPPWMFTEALLTVAKTWNQPKCPSIDG